MTLEQKIIYSKDIIRKVDPKQTFMSYSGGKDSTVLLRLIKVVHPKIKVISIDTGFEFPEMKEFINEQMKDMNHEWVMCTKDEHVSIALRYTKTKIIDGQWFCCARKKPALDGFLNKGEYCAWITGLRADETENRKHVGIYQDGVIEKINPIIFWTLEDIWEYIKKNNIKYHPLYDEGYKSLGCKPCTEAGFREGKANQGKFEDVGISGERPKGAECGIHI